MLNENNVNYSCVMKKVILILIVLLRCCFSADAQITIESCQTKAKANYPLIKRYALIDKTKDYNLSNAGKGYLPQLSLSAKASYQSDVTKVPISVPGVTGLSKDQYSVTLDVNQTIWDGGIIKAEKELTKSTAVVDQKQLEVTLYTINDRVNQIFFGILLLDAKLTQNQLLQDELKRNLDQMTSYIQYGIANQSDLDAIKVEQLKSEQNRAQLQSTRKAYFEMLSTLIGEKLDENVALVKPNIDNILIPIQINRPELSFYDAQYNNLEVQKKKIKTSYMPHLGLFATGGYGRPSLNMLDNKFDTYYIGGLRLSWNFGSLYTQKNSRRLIETNQTAIELERETFLFNTNLQMTQDNSEIKKNRDLLKYDDDIIRLRNNVKKASEAKVANGTMSATDLMRDITSEDLAHQDKIQHEIELLLSIYNLKYTVNN